MLDQALYSRYNQSMTTIISSNTGPSSPITLPQVSAPRAAFAAALREIRLAVPAVMAEIHSNPLCSSGRKRLIRQARQQLQQNAALKGNMLTAPTANPKLYAARNLYANLSTWAQSVNTPAHVTPPDSPIWSLSLAPADQSGSWHVCPGSTPACEAGCLGWHSGHAGMSGQSDNPVRRARRVRTAVLMQAETRHSAMLLLAHELEQAVWHTDSIQGLAIRMNAFSDIPWEAVWPELMEWLNKLRWSSSCRVVYDLSWYDYTKLPGRRPPRHLNYRLTLSWHPGIDREAGEWLAQGRNIAVIFNTPKQQPLPTRWRGYPVLDGTVTDTRWADPAGHIVGLRWKAARHWQASCRNAQDAGWVVDPLVRADGSAWADWA